MVVFTITKVNYLVVSLFNDLLGPFWYLLYICGIKFLGCTICLVSGVAKKVTGTFAKT